jgi:hypothetical protein
MNPAVIEYLINAVAILLLHEAEAATGVQDQLQEKLLIQRDHRIVSLRLWGKTVQEGCGEQRDKIKTQYVMKSDWQIRGPLGTAAASVQT